MKLNIKHNNSLKELFCLNAAVPVKARRFNQSSLWKLSVVHWHCNDHIALEEDLYAENERKGDGGYCNACETASQLLNLLIPSPMEGMEGRGG